MPGCSTTATHPTRAFARAASVLLLAVTLAATTAWASRTPHDWTELDVGSAPDHLVISEVMTGGSGASDEFIEIYNPAAGSLPLEGLELIYVSASGATVTRKAEWPAGTPWIEPGSHLLVANEAGIFAAIADATYANGLAATGGSVAIRISGAATAMDAVGWGSAASSWLEGSPAPPAAAGHSLERLPGGTSGSGQDTDQNSVDFVDRPLPDPQNSDSPPVPAPTATAQPSEAASPQLSPTPPATGTPLPTSTPLPTVTSTPTPAPTSAPSVISVADARAAVDGAEVTIEGVSLTDGAFSDGGGYVADPTGGIAVLVADGTFPRAALLRVTGLVDDRYHQRTIRTAAADVTLIAEGDEPDPTEVATGAIGEAFEGQLVSVSAAIISPASQLSTAVAFDIDDGSGPARLVVHSATGIDHSGWGSGTLLDLHGVVGQRDSSGGGASGYRLQPRDAADVLAVLPPPTPTPEPSAPGGASPSPGGSATPSPRPGLVSIAQAREAGTNERLTVRGVVTLPSGVLGDGTAAIQDASGAIILRLGDEAGGVVLGELLELDGVRSTKSGMETLRVTAPPFRIGSQAQPEPLRRSTGSLGEGDEARLVAIRGAVTSSPTRSAAQNVYFDLDDGSGPARVYLAPGAGIATDRVIRGSWLEIIGVLGQETSGRQPERGYRLWPRQPGDLRVIASAMPGGTDDGPGFVPLAPSMVAGEQGETDGMPPAVDLVPPQLTVAKTTRTGATIPPSGSGGEQPPGEAAGAAGWPAAVLLLFSALLAGSAAMAWVRSGLAERLRASLAIAWPLADRRDGPKAPTTEAEPGAPPGRNASALEETVARLVPLSVVEGDPPRPAARTSGTASRSTERILPPT